MGVTQFVTGLFLGICSVKDIKKKQIPIWLLASGSIVGIFSAFLMKDLSVQDRLFGAVLGVLLCGISWITRQALGMADAYLIFLLGISFGFQKTVELFFLSLVLCALFGMGLLAVHVAGRKTRIAYLPFLFTAFLFLGITVW